MALPKSKSAIVRRLTVTVILVTPDTLANNMVFEGFANAYPTPAVNACTRFMIPRIVPLPSRVVVMVSVLLPVFIKPLVIFTVAALMLLFSVSTFTNADLFTVSVLKVVAPVIFTSELPAN